MERMFLSFQRPYLQPETAHGPGDHYMMEQKLQKKRRQPQISAT
jgi:hypothetical protein